MLSRRKLSGPLFANLPLLAAFAVLVLLVPGGRLEAAAQRRWPTLEEQLARDHVVRGSVLEKVVRANQDTSVLSPEEEEGDGLDIPLWLRVMWKRAHPESRELEDDPSRGYPLVLQEAREWLVHHQDLKPVKDEPAALSSKLSVAGSSEKRISGAAATLHRSESDIRVFYANPSRIIAACNNNTFTGHQT